MGSDGKIRKGEEIPRMIKNIITLNCGIDDNDRYLCNAFTERTTLEGTQKKMILMDAVDAIFIKHKDYETQLEKFTKKWAILTFVFKTSAQCKIRKNEYENRIMECDIHE